MGELVDARSQLQKKKNFISKAKQIAEDACKGGTVRCGGGTTSSATHRIYIQ